MQIFKLGDCLERVLAILNKSQNGSYSPNIITNHFNIVTDALIDHIVERYPIDQTIIDLARPFYKRKVVKVVNGIAEIGEDYRNLITVAVGVNKQNKGTFTEGEVEDICKNQYEETTTNSNNGVFIRYEKVQILTENNFDAKSNSKYKAPSLTNAICKNIDGNKLLVLPRDVGVIEVRYIVNPKKYQLGYKKMVDETWQVDTSSPFHVESEWAENAATKLVKGVTTLYSMYSQDAELKNATHELKKIDFF